MASPKTGGTQPQRDQRAIRYKKWVGLCPDQTNSETEHLQEGGDDAFGVIVPSHLALLLHASNGGTALRLRLAHCRVGYEALVVAHAGVDVDLVGRDPEWAVGRYVEPRVYLPDEVEDEDERQSEVLLKKIVGSRRCMERLGPPSAPVRRMHGELNPKRGKRIWKHSRRWRCRTAPQDRLR